MSFSKYVFFYLHLHTEYRSMHPTSKGGFLSREDILTAPHNFKGLFEGSYMVLRLRFELGLGQGEDQG